MGVKVYDGSSAQWVEFGGGGGSGSSGTPGGNDKQVQFNDNGTLAGADALEFQKDTDSPDLILKPASTAGSGIHGGNIIAESTINTGTTPWNSASITADGGLELFRSRNTGTIGGPYIDYKAVAGVDFDARIQMDYANGNVSGQAIDPTSADYSALTFQTGGNSYYESTNTTGRTTEKIRIGKFGEIGISAGVQIYDPTQNPPIIFNNRTDAQKYGSSGAVIVSNGKGSSVSWSKKSVASAYVNFHGGTNIDGNCTMRDSFGVSSVSDNGTGDYTVNWASNFPNVNYTVTVSHSQAPNNGATHGVLYTNGYAVDYVKVINFADSSSVSLVDKDVVCVVVHTTHTTT